MEEHNEVGKPVPGFIHLGHTLMFTVEDFELGKLADGEVKNDLLIDTMMIEKLASGLAAKMMQREGFKNIILYTVFIYEAMLAKETEKQ